MGSAEELSESGRRMRLAREAGGGVPGFLAGSLLINHNPGYFYTNNSKINDPSLLPGWLLLVQRLLRKSRSGMVTGGCGPALLSAWVGPRRLSLRKPLLGGPCPGLLCGFQCRARLCRVRLRQPSWPWRRAGRCRHLRREARLGRLPGNPRRPRPRLWSSAEHLPPVPLGRWGLETAARPPAPGPQAAAGPSPGRALLHARMTAGPVLWPRLGRVSGVGTRASPRPIGHRHRI